ncbi:MAG: hypothetical protein GY847_35200 [Proteobacteria bacterium]|nr:hypothetical protein [Pseudomonadota bacterium]
MNSTNDNASSMRTAVDRFLTECKTTSIVVWAYIRCLVALPLGIWKERVLQRALRDRKAAFGESLIASGAGDEELSKRANELEERIADRRAASVRSRDLELEHRGVLIRIADLALSGTEAFDDSHGVVQAVQTWEAQCETVTRV